MANIVLNESNIKNPLIKLFFWYQKKKYGQVLEPALAWANAPLIFWRFLRLWHGFNRRNSPLNKDLRALVCLFVSQQNQCAYCIDLHSAMVLKSEPKKVLELANFKSSPVFSEIEKVVLNYAQQMGEVPVNISSELTLELKKYFSDKNLVELTGLIAFQNMSAKFNAALGVAAHGFCRLNLK
jgi:alkylhydroperoxidase family enzyme